MTQQLLLGDHISRFSFRALPGVPDKAITRAHNILFSSTFLRFLRSLVSSRHSNLLWSCAHKHLQPRHLKIMEYTPSIALNLIASSQIDSRNTVLAGDSDGWCVVCDISLDRKPEILVPYLPSMLIVCQIEGNEKFFWSHGIYWPL